MSLAEMEIIYNLVFILILIVVCALFCLIQLFIAKKITMKHWAINTVQFVSIVLLTIFIWRVAIPMITKVPL